MSGGARIPLLTRDEMDDAQRAVHDAVVSGPRGELIGPLRAAIHTPELAAKWSALGEFLRFRTCLPKRLNELAIVVTGRRWEAQIEWWVHARVAAEAGISADVIDAIRDLREPVFADPAEYDVYEYARTLQRDGQVGDAVHKAIVDRWAVAGVVELTAVIGYYTMVAMTLNAHCLPVPGDHEPLPALGRLAELAPARLERAA